MMMLSDRGANPWFLPQKSLPFVHAYVTGHGWTEAQILPILNPSTVIQIWFIITQFLTKSWKSPWVVRITLACLPLAVLCHLIVPVAEGTPESGESLFESMHALLNIFVFVLIFTRACVLLLNMCFDDKLWIELSDSCGVPSFLSSPLFSEGTFWNGYSCILRSCQAREILPEQCLLKTNAE